MRTFHERAQELTAESIKKNPSLANEFNLILLMKSLILIHEGEGKDEGGYDSNLQSYYGKRLTVTKNDSVFESIKMIVECNPSVVSDLVDSILSDLSTCSVYSQITSSSLSSDTSYLGMENEKEAVAERARILHEVKELFGN